MVFSFFKKDKDTEPESASSAVSTTRSDSEKSLFTGDRRISAEIDFGFGTFTWDDSGDFSADTSQEASSFAATQEASALGLPETAQVELQEPSTAPDNDIEPSQVAHPNPLQNQTDLLVEPAMEPSTTQETEVETEPVINLDAMMMMGAQSPAPESPPLADSENLDISQRNEAVENFDTSQETFPPAMALETPEDFAQPTPPDFGTDDFTFEPSPSLELETPEDFAQPAPPDFGADDFTLEPSPFLELETPEGDFAQPTPPDFGADDFTLEPSPSLELEAPEEDFTQPTPPDFGADDFTLEPSPSLELETPEDFAQPTPPDFGADDFTLEPSPSLELETPEDFTQPTPPDFGADDFTLEPSPSLELETPEDFTQPTPPDFGADDFTLEPSPSLELETPEDFTQPAPPDFEPPPGDTFPGEVEWVHSPESDVSESLDREEATEDAEPTWELSTPSYEPTQESIPDLSAPVQESTSFMPEAESPDDLSWMPEPQGFQDFSVSMDDDFYDHAAPGFEPDVSEDAPDDTVSDMLLDVDRTLYPSEAELDATDLSGMIPHQDPFTAELPDMDLGFEDDAAPVLDLSPHLGQDIEAIERANRLLEESLNAPLDSLLGEGDETEATPGNASQLAFGEAAEKESDDFTVIDSCPISGESRLFMVAMDGIYALMGESGPSETPSVEVLKVFQNNPLIDNPLLQALPDSQAENPGTFIVHAGSWKGIISQDNDKLILLTELPED